MDERLCVRLTRNDVTRVHGVLVLDEAKAVHELDLGDFAGTMRLEVRLDIGLGGVAWEVAQVQAGRRDLGHDGCLECQGLENLAG